MTKQLHELSGKTLRSYTKKAGPDLAKRAFAAGKSSVSNPTKSHFTSSGATKRQVGIKRAADRLAKYGSTKRTNIKQSADDVGKKAFKAGASARWGTPKTPASGAVNKLDKAVSKTKPMFAKEQNEVINEVKAADKVDTKATFKGKSWFMRDHGKDAFQRHGVKIHKIIEDPDTDTIEIKTSAPKHKLDSACGHLTDKDYNGTSYGGHIKEGYVAEGEQLDELSKGTLGRYIKKATSDHALNSARAAIQDKNWSRAAKQHDRARTSADRRDYKDEMKFTANLADKAYDKARRRKKGLNKAVDKLTAEDTRLDELSPALKSRYKGKASTNLSGANWSMSYNYSKAGDEEDRGNTKKADDYHNKGLKAARTANKRTRGLARLKNTTEETRLDEVSKTLKARASKAAFDKSDKLLNKSTDARKFGADHVANLLAKKSDKKWAQGRKFQEGSEPARPAAVHHNKRTGDRFEMHHKGPNLGSAIVKTHQGGKHLKNEHGGYTAVHVGSPKYVHKKWTALVDKQKRTTTNSMGGRTVGPGYHEAVEPLDELKRSTLASYIKKARSSSEMHGHRADVAAARSNKAKNKSEQEYMRTGDTSKWDKKAAQQDAKFNTHSRKYSNRVRGIDKAADRLAKEETEHLDELSKKTLGSYSKKASDASNEMSYRKGIRSFDPTFGGDQTKRIDRLGRRIEKRKVGLDRAINRLTKEEAEHLDELSPATLGRYAKKAVDRKVNISTGKIKPRPRRQSQLDKGLDRAQQRLTGNTTDRYADDAKNVAFHKKAAKKTGIRKQTSDFHASHAQRVEKAGKRQIDQDVSSSKGYKIRSTNKVLSREAVEPLDELSPATLSRYAKKAGKKGRTTGVKKAMTRLGATEGQAKRFATNQFMGHIEKSLGKKRGGYNQQGYRDSGDKKVRAATALVDKLSSTSKGYTMKRPAAKAHPSMKEEVTPMNENVNMEAVIRQITIDARLDEAKRGRPRKHIKAGTEEEDIENIIMQLRKAVSLGWKDVEFADRSKHKVTRRDASLAIQRFNDLKTSTDKAKLQSAYAANYNSLMNAIKKGAPASKPAGISLGTLRR